MSNTQQNYPKRVWVLVQAEVILEGNKEVISHENDQMIGATFNHLVAEKMAAVLKENQSDETLLKSNINPLPTAVLDLVQESNSATLKETDSSIDYLLSMVDLSPQTPTDK